MLNSLCPQLREIAMSREKFLADLSGLVLLDREINVNGVVYVGKQSDDGIVITANGEVCQEFKHTLTRNYWCNGVEISPTPRQRFAKFILELCPQ